MYIGTLKALLAVAICSYTYNGSTTTTDNLESVNINIDYSLNIGEQITAPVSFLLKYDYNNLTNDGLNNYEATKSYTITPTLTTTGNQDNKNIEDITYYWLKMENLELYVNGEDNYSRSLEINVSSFFVEVEFTNDLGERTYWNYLGSLSFYINRGSGLIATDANIKNYKVNNIEIFKPFNMLHEAHNIGYNKGYEEGYVEGLLLNNAYSVGYQDGFRQGELAGFEEGRQQGIIEGGEDGYNIGFEDGYVVGEQAGIDSKYKVVDIIKRAFEIVVIILKIEILPGVPLAVAFGIPLILSIVFFVLRMFR